MKIIFSMVCFMCICQATKEDDITCLESKLLSNYSSILKPRKHQNEPVDVNISLFIISVRDVNEKNQFLSFYGFFDIKWNDDFLKWNKSDFPDVEYVNIPNKNVWTPDVGLYGSFGNFYDLGFVPFVTVFSDGIIKWYPGDQYTVDCEINVRKFPFDEQKCAIVVGAWQTTDWMQRLLPIPEKTNIDTISKNGEWEFLYLSVSYAYWDEFNITAVRYDLSMKRKCLYYLLNILLPVMILAFLNTFTFLLPPSSGDRTQYSVTLFVAFSVFITLFQQITPTSSTDLPFLTIYVTFHLLLSSVSVITSLMRCRIISRKILNKIRELRFFGSVREKGYTNSSSDMGTETVTNGGLDYGSIAGAENDSDNENLKGINTCIDNKEKKEVEKISLVPFSISLLCLCASTTAFYLSIYF